MYGPSKAGVVASIVGVLLVLSLLFVWLLCTTTSVPPNKVGVHFTGGPIDGRKFVDIVSPGTGAKMYGIMEKVYLLPNGVRYYTVSRDPELSDTEKVDFFIAPSKDRAAFTFEGQAFFELNKNENVIKQFFNDICLHSKCWTDDGWDKTLAQFLRPQFDLAVAQATKGYTKDQLYGDAATLDAMNEEIGKALAEGVNAKLGGRYFCGPGSTKEDCKDFEVVIKNPQPTKGVLDSYNALASAANNAKAAETAAQGRAAAARTAAEGDRDAADTRAQARTLSPEQLAYLRVRAIADCAAREGCTLIVTDGAAGVNVNAGG